VLTLFFVLADRHLFPLYRQQSARLYSLLCIDTIRSNSGSLERKTITFLRPWIWAVHDRKKVFFQRHFWNQEVYIYIYYDIIQTTNYGNYKNRYYSLLCEEIKEVNGHTDIFPFTSFLASLTSFLVSSGIYKDTIITSSTPRSPPLSINQSYWLHSPGQNLWMDMRGLPWINKMI
jgi:hypothetical protein